MKSNTLYQQESNMIETQQQQDREWLAWLDHVRIMREKRARQAILMKMMDIQWQKEMDQLPFDRSDERSFERELEANIQGVKSLSVS